MHVTRRPLFVAHAVISTLLVQGCAPKHPVEALQREAKRFDRDAGKQVSAVLSDQAYFVPTSDALSAASTALGAPVAEVAKARVGSDWVYSGAVGVDPTSEYYDQRRKRTGVAPIRWTLGIT